MVQSTVTNNVLATGIPGEPSRGARDLDSQGAILNSATEANNIVGRVVHYVDGNPDEVGVAADGNLAGVLVNPKAGVRPQLAAQGFLNNATQVEFAKAGYWFVTLPAAADAGDFVYFSDTTGELATAAPGVAPAAGYSRLPGGKVERIATVAGVAEIYFDARSGSTETPTA